jgi:hypothetical protein
MKTSNDALERDVCPVGDEMLGALYRASENGLPALIDSVPPLTRAMLALFCYRRSHLQPLALTIASTCEERDLVHWGAALGSALYAMSHKSEAKAVPAPTFSRSKITLPSKPLATFAPIDIDFDDDGPEPEVDDEALQTA